MRDRSDPLVPVLGSAVAVVVVGAIAFIFYPKISRLLEDRHASVVGRPPAPDARVPVWVGHTAGRVAFVLRVRGDRDGHDAILDEALAGGPYRYLTLRVYNFGSDAFELAVPDAGYASAEGGPRARPAASLLPDQGVPEHLRAVLRGYGAVDRVLVEKGRSAQVLLVLEGDPAMRTSFFIDESVRLERKELERRVLASWQQRPDWRGFSDFY